MCWHLCLCVLIGSEGKPAHHVPRRRMALIAAEPTDGMIWQGSAWFSFVDFRLAHTRILDALRNARSIVSPMRWRDRDRDGRSDRDTPRHATRRAGGKGLSPGRRQRKRSPRRSSKDQTLLTLASQKNEPCSISEKK